MKAKDIYRLFIGTVNDVPYKIEVTKTIVAEDIAIVKKAPLYKSVKWSKEKQRQFDAYWKKVYGKTISNKWHRLYESMSGSYAVDYIPEKLYTTKIEPAFNDNRYAIALEDKSIVELLSKDCGCVVPDTYVVCSNGQLYDHDRKPISLTEAVLALKGKDFVLKPTVGSSSGRGLMFCKKADTVREQYLVNILQNQGKDYIVQASIKSHESYAVFNPSSINTIRITTYISNNTLHHIPIAFRIGREAKKVDNIHAGGLGVGVEDDGRLLPYAFDLGYGDKVVKYSMHPDSKVVFRDYKLPYIQEIINAAYNTHGRFPHIGIISWDFTIDENGNVVLIEANIKGQGIWFPQIIHGKGAFGKHTSEVFNKLGNNEITKPIRVLCVFGALDRGGAETMCMNLFRHIDRKVVVFDFVKHTDKIGAFEEEIKELGGMIYTCPALTTRSYLQYVSWWNKHFVNHPEHQIVHGHMFTTSGIYFRVAHRYKRITVGHSHCASNGIELDDRSRVEVTIRKFLRDRIALYSDYRLACSYEAGKLIFPNDDFLVLNNAIDASKYRFDDRSRKEIRKEFNVPDDYMLITAIGSIVPVKNPQGVVNICKELANRSGKWKLIWCGAGSLFGDIKDCIEKENLKEQIVMAGVRSDIHKVLQGADVFLMPSLFEGLPVAAIEAQAAGIPCFLSETISSDTDITGLCHFLPLNQWGLWADMILNQKIERKDTTELIKKAGFDIETTSQWLQNYYLQILNDHT